MQKTVSIFLILIFFISTSMNYAAEKEKIKEKAELSELVQQSPEPFASRSLLIFLDDSEDAPRAIGHTLMVALYQKAAPILVSASLLAVVARDRVTMAHSIAREERFYFDILDRVRETIISSIRAGKTTKEIADIINKNYLYFPDDLPFATNNKLVSEVFGTIFNPDEWIIKDVNGSIDRYGNYTSGSLYLLIPKAYLAKELDLENYKSLPRPLAPDATVTEMERKLGLKIDHMLTLSPKEYAYLRRTRPDDRNYLIHTLWNNRLKTSDVFLTKSDYFYGGSVETLRQGLTHKEWIVFMKDLKSEYDKKKTTQPTWAIYITGHGNEGSIVGLTIPEFKDLLYFLDTKINTKLFIYSSCYAAATNSKLAYGDLKQAGSGRPYSFAIATEALTEAPVSLIPPKLAIGPLRADNIDMQNRWLKINSPLNFKAFVDNVSQPSTINFSTALAPILSQAHESHGRIKISAIQNLPQIRFPGIGWFAIIDAQNNVFSIGNILAKTRTEPLNISRFLTRKHKAGDPSAILLYTEAVPFPFLISKQWPAIVSMIPGNAIHYLERIDSQTKTVDIVTILEAFLQITGLNHDKEFWIDTIQAPDVLPASTEGVPFLPPTKSGFVVITNVYIHLFPSYTLQAEIMFNHAGKLYITQATLDKNYQRQLINAESNDPRKVAEHKKLSNKFINKELQEEIKAMSGIRRILNKEKREQAWLRAKQARLRAADAAKRAAQGSQLAGRTPPGSRDKLLIDLHTSLNLLSLQQ